ncbi:MAG: hypothetical protein FJ255_01950 [Phycisphaerae bacterium]|nr:hypothetical protein [Phycisphaerae bacterium]
MTSGAINPGAFGADLHFGVSAWEEVTQRIAAGDTASASGVALRAWDESRHRPFGARIRVMCLWPALEQVLARDPACRTALEARMTDTATGLRSAPAKPEDVVGLAILGTLLGDAPALSLARQAGVGIKPDEFFRSFGPVKPALTATLYFDRLGLAGIAGRALPTLPGLLSLLESTENWDPGMESGVRAPLGAAMRRIPPDARPPLSWDDLRRELLWGPTRDCARCLHAAGRNTDALAVLRRAAERGLEARARALITELGLE